MKAKNKNKVKNKYLEEYINNEHVKSMDSYVQHGSTSTLEHCIAVTEKALELNQKYHLNASEEALTKIGMLHDFYLYDWHEKSDDHRWHGFHHAEKAADNAATHFDLTENELRAIRSHMWPLNISKIPHGKEAWLLCIADKICSTRETVQGGISKVKSKRINKTRKEDVCDFDVHPSIDESHYKYDLHCHVHEGSSDSAVKAEEFISILMDKGFSGMLITDHDTYNGWRFWKDKLKDKYPDFTVLKGIEYDTDDAGHIIVVLPCNTELPVLEARGLKVRKLIKLVHDKGGVLGPAHPCGEPFLSIFSTGKFRKDDSIAAQFDFIEGFNACEFEKDCMSSFAVADKYNKPTTGGSDAHHHGGVGMGYSVFDTKINNEDEFIEYIKSGKKPISGGTRYYGTTRDRLGIFNKGLVYGFWLYNKFETAVHTPSRKKKL